MVATPGDAANELERARQRMATVESSPALDCVRGVLCDPTRLRIVSALEGVRLPVGDLATVIGRRMPATSQHLRVLRDLGLVTARRSRSQVFYSLRPGAAIARVRAVLSAVRRPVSAAN